MRKKELAKRLVDKPYAAPNQTTRDRIATEHRMHIAQAVTPIAMSLL